MHNAPIVCQPAKKRREAEGGLERSNAELLERARERPVGFKGVYVFDVSHTVAKPSLEFANVPGDSSVYTGRLRTFAGRKGVEIRYSGVIAAAEIVDRRRRPQRLGRGYQPWLRVVTGLKPTVGWPSRFWSRFSYSKLTGVFASREPDRHVHAGHSVRANRLHSQYHDRNSHYQQPEPAHNAARSDD